MSKIYQIALNTFRESIRDKVLYVIVFFAMMMLIASQGLGWVSVGEELQIVQHFSLAVVSLFGALIGVFVGTGLIYKEIDKRTIYTILSKPVKRYQFVLGKFLGLQGVLLSIVFSMGFISTAFVYYVAATGSGGAGAVNWGMYVDAIVMVYFELMVVTALAILFSSVASPILAAIFTFCAYLIGHVTPSLMDLVERQFSNESVANMTGEHLTDAVASTQSFWKPFSWVMYQILPNLTHFEVRNRVVFGPPLNHGRYIIDGELFQSIAYAVLYSTAVLMVAILCFNRKRF
ncbi:MAG: ABC transporter permease [Planctomycetes bacterium]|nr:ABC transporter permease [Planctomycetota bacterium]